MRLFGSRKYSNLSISTKEHNDSWLPVVSLTLLYCDSAPPHPKKKGKKNPHLMKHWGSAAWHGRYNPHPVSWTSSTELILWSQDQKRIVSSRELTLQSHNFQFCNKWFLSYKLLMKYLIYKFTTDLILNVFQERLWSTVVINDSHASLLPMTIEKY